MLLPVIIFKARISNRYTVSTYSLPCCFASTGVLRRTLGLTLSPPRSDIYQCTSEPQSTHTTVWMYTDSGLLFARSFSHCWWFFLVGKLSPFMLHQHLAWCCSLPCAVTAEFVYSPPGWDDRRLAWAGPYSCPVVPGVSSGQLGEDSYPNTKCLWL